MCSAGLEQVLGSLDEVCSAVGNGGANSSPGSVETTWDGGSTAGASTTANDKTSTDTSGASGQQTRAGGQDSNSAAAVRAAFATWDILIGLVMLVVHI